MVGEAADGLNALWYTYDGDYVNAGLSSAAMLPVAGNFVTGAKAGQKLLKSANAAQKILKFGGDEAIIHFTKHAGEIMKVTGKSSYDLKNYLDDANWIVQNGTFSTSLNGYFHFVGTSSKGQALFGFVGLKNWGTTISTFHIKTASQLGLK